MTSLVRSTSTLFVAQTALDELRARILSCKASAPATLRLTLHDIHDALCRIQSECSGAAASIPLSVVEALGLARERLTMQGERGEFSVDCGIAAAQARRALELIAESQRISPTSEAYLRRLGQFLGTLSRPH